MNAIMHNRAATVFLAFFMTLNISLSVHAEVPRTISYQGYLTDSSGDRVDTTSSVPLRMRFAIYDADAGGSLIWSEMQYVTIQQGVYSVVLGSSIGNPLNGSFDQEYFLEAAVDEDDSGTIEPTEILSPRQRLTAVPYAFNADTLDGHDSAELQTRVSGSCSEGFSIRQVNADGSVLCEEDTDTTYSAGPGLNLTGTALSVIGPLDLSGSTGGTGAAISGANTGGGYGLYGRSPSNYGVYGYSVSVAGVSGYSSGGPGVYGVNGSWGNYGYLGDNDYGVYGKGMTSSSTGVYGINNSSGNYGWLGSQYYGVFGYGSGIYSGVNGNNSSGNYGALGHATAGVYGQSSSGNVGHLGSAGYGVYGSTGTGTAGYFTSSSGYGLIVNSGKVGVGTTTPTNLLDLVSTSGLFMGLDFGANENAGISFSEAGTTRWIFPFFRGWQSDNLIVRDEFSLKDVMTFQSGTGRVGVGTNAPKQQIHNAGDYYGKGHVWLHAYQGDGSSGTAYLQARDDSGTSSISLLLRSQNAGSPIDGVSIASNGDVGIGTISPSVKFHVAGNYMKVNGAGNEQAYIGGDGAGGDIEVGSTNPAVTNVSLWNSASSVRMDLYLGALHIMGGADLAEPFDFSDASLIEPGMLVSIDPDKPGSLKVSDKAFDHAVAGVVSGAKGIKPGLTMRQEGTEAEGQYPVALSGRVYAWVDASYGAVEPGDLLTTSNTPGHAMKLANHETGRGAVIGKAMTSLEKGKGLVLVLVSMH